MSDGLTIRIDLAELRRHLSVVSQQIVPDETVLQWLDDHGFKRQGELWLATDFPKSSALPSSAVIEAEADSGWSVPDDLVVPPEARYWDGPPPWMLPADKSCEPSLVNLAQLRVPAVLIGRYPDVSRRWRSISKKAVRTGSWEAALSDQALVHVSQTPGSIMLDRPSPFVQEDHLILSPVRDLLFETARGPDFDARYLCQRNLVLDGLKYFWFCFALLAHGLWMVGSDIKEIEAPRLKFMQLEKLLHWWPVFVALSGRYSSNGDQPERWPQWGGTVLTMCVSIGVQRSEAERALHMDPAEAGELMKKWVEERRNSIGKVPLIDLDTAAKSRDPRSP